MIRTARIDTITLQNRQRKNFNRASIDELAKSIAEKGLFHPVVCVQQAEHLTLVAGERRLRAVQQIFADNMLFSCDGQLIEPHSIPYILLTDLDAISLREAELEENTHRVDLTWQERVAAVDELHELRSQRNPKQSNLDTAKEISTKSDNISVQSAEKLIAKSRLLAKHLDDPEIARAKDIKQAYNIVSRKLERQLSSELSKRKIHTPSRHTLIQGDLLAHISALTNVSCIIVDPPYGIGADSFGDAQRLSHTYNDTHDYAMNLCEGILKLGFKITTENAHLYMFCDSDNFNILKQTAKVRGWHPFRTPLVWFKGGIHGHAPIGARGFRRSYELILFASKGTKPFTQIYSDVYEIPDIRDKAVAAQKPATLYETMLSRSCIHGETVLDPCCGSGTIFLAAEQLNLTAIGIENNPNTCEVAQETLNSITELEVEPENEDAS